MIVYYILYFCIYAFIGWLLETTYATIKQREFVNRGVLIGPFLPIYGFGALLIIVSSSWLYFKGIYSISISVLTSIVLVTVLEYITGAILDKLFINNGGIIVIDL